MTFNGPDFFKILLSILFEGAPFLLLGSLVSGIVDAFVPAGALTKILPKNSALAILVSGLLGGIFPMCECGSVMVIRRFIKKGLPVSAAATYMLAAPIVNPVVALSTYMAFRGQGPFEMMAMRLFLGFVIAVAVGFITRMIPLQNLLQPEILASLNPPKRTAFRISAPAPDSGSDMESAIRNGFFQKLLWAVRAASSDFLDVAKFLVIGAAIAAFFKIAADQNHIQSFASVLPLSIVVMIVLAFMLAICSTSDSFIAASFVSFPFQAKLAFLVFGAMFDVKLMFLYQVIFRRKFVFFLAIGLFIAVTLICLRIPAPQGSGIPGLP